METYNISIILNNGESLPVNVEAESFEEVSRKAIEKSKFKLIPGRFTFVEGMAECASRGWKMAIIRNDFENALAYAKVKQHAQNVYIGHVRRGPGKNFISIRGSSTYMNFAPGEPNNGGKYPIMEECVVLNWHGLHHPTAKHMWNDLRCDAQCNVLCESSETDPETCGKKTSLNSTTGIIVSHSGFTRMKYRTDMQCLWTISGPPNTVVRLIFTAFKIQGSRNCTKDRLSVFEDRDTRGVLLSIKCGDKATNVLSFGPAVTLQFLSDDSVTGAGFKILYQMEDANVFTVDLPSDSTSSALLGVPFLLFAILLLLAVLLLRFDVRSPRFLRRPLARQKPAPVSKSFKELLQDEEGRAL